MTLLEKAVQDHPGLDKGKIVTWMCPCDFGYEKLNEGCIAAGADVQETCWNCWNREVTNSGD